MDPRLRQHVLPLSLCGIRRGRRQNWGLPSLVHAGKEFPDVAHHFDNGGVKTCFLVLEWSDCILSGHFPWCCRLYAYTDLAYFLISAGMGLARMPKVFEHPSFWWDIHG